MIVPYIASFIWFKGERLRIYVSFLVVSSTWIQWGLKYDARNTGEICCGKALERNTSWGNESAGLQYIALKTVELYLYTFFPLVVKHWKCNSYFIAVNEKDCKEILPFWRIFELIFVNDLTKNVFVDDSQMLGKLFLASCCASERAWIVCW